ncbi:hypothetical protein [Streptomyces sp. NPDC057413]|uniref:hypothetical protein n=1 Tax=Streptomyces sp. NPDC057413 TaxID=3346124 RepID=UPI00368B8E92
MTGIPAAAVAVIAAAFDDYRLTTPTHQQTPRGAAERAAEYLASGGWGLYVPRAQAQPRVPCPTCGCKQLVTSRGLVRRHGAHGNPCRGSGAPVRPAVHA